MGRLDGCVVATTRDGDPEDTLVQRLEADGARVLLWPTLVTEGPRDATPLTRAVEGLASYDWIAFTSARAASALVDLAVAPANEPRKPRVAAVGEATSAALKARGWTVDVVASGHGAAALVDAMAAVAELDGARVLFPASSLARPTLEEELGVRHARVDRVEAYHVRTAPPEHGRIRADLDAGVDVVTFASPSAVRALAETFGGDLPGGLAGTGVAAIGRTTAHALEELGVQDVEVAPRPGMDGLVDACVTLTNRQPRKA